MVLCHPHRPPFVGGDMLTVDPSTYAASAVSSQRRSGERNYSPNSKCEWMVEFNACIHHCTVVGFRLPMPPMDPRSLIFPFVVYGINPTSTPHIIRLTERGREMQLIASSNRRQPSFDSPLSSPYSRAITESIIDRQLRQQATAASSSRITRSTPPAAPINYLDRYIHGSPEKNDHRPSNDFRCTNYTPIVQPGYPRSDWLIEILPPVLRVSNIRRVFRTLYDGSITGGHRAYGVLAEVFAFGGMHSNTLTVIDAITERSPMTTSIGEPLPWRVVNPPGDVRFYMIELCGTRSDPGAILTWVIYLINAKSHKYRYLTSDIIFHLLCDAWFVPWLVAQVYEHPAGTMYVVDDILRFILRGWTKSDTVHWPVKYIPSPTNVCRDEFLPKLKAMMPHAEVKLKQRIVDADAFLAQRIQIGGITHTDDSPGKNARLKG